MAKFCIDPLVKADPALANLERWCSGGSLAYRFRRVVSEAQEKLTRDHPDLSHQALADKVSQNRLTLQENRHIENEVREFNDKIQQTFQSVNAEKQRRFKQAKRNYRTAKRSPGGWSKPDKNKPQYHCYSFNIRQSPFNTQNFRRLLVQNFQDLADEERQKTFARTPHLTADKERLTLHNELDKSTQALAQMHQDLQGKNYELQAKEAQLKREMEQLQRLTRLSQAYQALPETDDDLTSPSERIRELEALLAQKRKGV